MYTFSSSPSCPTYYPTRSTHCSHACHCAPSPTHTILPLCLELSSPIPMWLIHLWLFAQTLFCQCCFPLYLFKTVNHPHQLPPILTLPPHLPYLLQFSSKALITVWWHTRLFYLSYSTISSREHIFFIILLISVSPVPRISPELPHPSLGLSSFYI